MWLEQVWAVECTRTGCLWLRIKTQALPAGGASFPSLWDSDFQCDLAIYPLVVGVHGRRLQFCDGPNAEVKQPQSKKCKSLLLHHRGMTAFSSQSVNPSSV